MVLHPADSTKATGVVDARVIAVLLAQVAGLVGQAVVVGGADGLGRLPRQAVSPVRVPVGPFGALALVRAWQVGAAGSLGARRGCQLRALVNVSADPVRQQPVATWANAEASLPASVDALLVLRAGVGRGAVSARGDAVVVFPLKNGRAAAVASVHAEQVPWALELVRASHQLVAIGARVARVSGRALAGGLVVDHSAPGMLPTGTRQQAGVVTFQHRDVASLVAWTVTVSRAFPFRWLTSGMERFAGRSWWAGAVVAAHVVVALRSTSTGEGVLLTLVYVPADAVWQENESLGADAEARVAAFIHALLVFRAWVGRRTVDARQEAEGVPLPKGSRAATPIAEALQIAGAFLIVSAVPGNGALDVRVPSKPTWTEALWPVVDTSALSSTTTNAGFEAGVVALLGEGVAGLAVLAVGVAGAPLDALAAAAVVGVARQAVGAAALVASGKVGTHGTMGTGPAAVQALVDVLALGVHAHISRSTVMILSAFG